MNDRERALAHFAKSANDRRHADRKSARRECGDAEHERSAESPSPVCARWMPSGCCDAGVTTISRSTLAKHRERQCATGLRLELKIRATGTITARQPMHGRPRGHCGGGYLGRLSPSPLRHDGYGRARIARAREFRRQGHTHSGDAQAQAVERRIVLQRHGRLGRGLPFGRCMTICCCCHIGAAAGAAAGATDAACRPAATGVSTCDIPMLLEQAPMATLQLGVLLLEPPGALQLAAASIAARRWPAAPG